MLAGEAVERALVGGGEELLEVVVLDEVYSVARWAVEGGGGLNRDMSKPIRSSRCFVCLVHRCVGGG